MSIPRDFYPITPANNRILLFSLQPTEESKYKLIARRLEPLNNECFAQTKMYNEITVVIIRDNLSYFTKIEDRVLAQARSCLFRIYHHTINCEENGNNLYVYLKYT